MTWLRCCQVHSRRHRLLRPPSLALQDCSKADRADSRQQRALADDKTCSGCLEVKPATEFYKSIQYGLASNDGAANSVCSRNMYVPEQVYGASSTQDAIYDGTARDIVDAAFDGYNGKRLPGDALLQVSAVQPPPKIMLRNKSDAASAASHHLTA